MPSRSASKTKDASILLIDGHAFLYRAYYAIRNLSNSRGEATGAIYGFITMMQKLLAAENPDYLAVCFDRKEPTFRHKKFEDYKAHRKPMPEDLVEQIEPIKEFCKAYHFSMFEMAGFEADDVIGTLARRAAKKGINAYIVTSDKDAMQLVDDHIFVINPHKDDMVFDRAAVVKRYGGIEPENVVDVMALMGDQSDNIPGVPGIGEKTALKLIKEFGSVENLLKHVGRIKSKSQQELLRANEKLAILSKDLARIDTEVPLEFKWEDLTMREPDEAKLKELLTH